MAQVLIISRPSEFSDALAFFISFLGHGARRVPSPVEGLALMSEAPCDLVFFDLDLLGSLADHDHDSPITLLRRSPGLPEVIVVSSEESPELLDQAFAQGAWDCIRKPLVKEQVRKLLLRVLQYREERGVSRQAVRLIRGGIVGAGSAVERCLGQVAEAARGQTSVLISGETGTGKELFARAIHLNSPRASGPFVTVDCASLPATLVESVLFGHEKGAFTGATSASPGLVRQANGGSLFLDEVGELPLEIQKKFLRVLQEQRFRPVGGQEEVESDFRLLAATNRNLDQLVRERLFREDLLFRLRVLSLDLPPLRERKSDIAELVMARLVELCRGAGLPMKNFCADFLEVLLAYDWPGNVRELHNVVEAAFVRAFNEPTLFSIHLPADLRVKVRMRTSRNRPSVSRITPPPESALSFAPGCFPSLQDVRDEALSRAELRYFSDLIQFAGDDLKKAAEIAGLSKSRLYHLLQKHEVQR